MKSITKQERELTLKKAKQNKLNPQQLEYCYYYTNKDAVTYGNATLSYAMAYNYDIPLRNDGTIDTASTEYRVCQAASSRMNTLPVIREQIEGILIERLNDKSVDSRLSSIIHAGRDTDSIQGIKIYNDLKGRVVRNLNVNVAARPLEAIPDDELEKIVSGENL